MKDTKPRSTSSPPFGRRLISASGPYIKKKKSLKDAGRREQYLKTAKGRTTIKTMLKETLKP